MRDSRSSRIRKARGTATLVDGALRAGGVRPTRGRRALYAVLRERSDHPTAETLHRTLRRRMPDLSLATVYTTLEVLVGAGLVGRLPGPDGVARYDARVDRHDHRRCLGCGRIDDLDRASDLARLDRFHAPGFRATDFHIEVVGYCAACSDAGGASPSFPGPGVEARIEEKGDHA